MSDCKKYKNADFKGVDTKKFVCWCWYEHIEKNRKAIYLFDTALRN